MWPSLRLLMSYAMIEMGAQERKKRKTVVRLGRKGNKLTAAAE